MMKLIRRQDGAFEVTVYIDGIFEHHRWQKGNAPHSTATCV
jgi:hypothetical protein